MPRYVIERAIPAIGSAARDDLRVYNNRILDYAKNGGVVIVQYNTPEFDHNYGPYPYNMTSNPEEVTDETSQVQILEPQNPVFTWPNKITTKDFENWVEERGSKFLESWDAAYEPLLETHDPANCSKVLPDLAGLSSFTYGSHYCSVDNRHDATTLACGYFNSGIRVFDIRNPERPKEIAYYNPAGTTTASPGSNHNRSGGWGAGGPDWCNAQIRLDAATASLQTTCQDNGFLSLKFTNGAWPFPESSTPAGLQN